MRKYLKRVIALTMITMLLCPITAMATPRGRQELMQGIDEPTVLLPESVKTSVGRETTAAKSKALASAMCMITNKENGIINVYAETLMFQSVDWAALTMYLEQLNETTGKWSVVETVNECRVFGFCWHSASRSLLSPSLHPRVRIRQRMVRSQIHQNRRSFIN